MPPGCPFPGGCPAIAAELYPSTIVVDGETSDLTSVAITLHDLTAEAPADLDIMLVAPDGTAVMVMSDACGTNAALNPITSPITLTFDDDASAPLPADTPCTGGTFQPVDDDNDSEYVFMPVDNFPSAPEPTSATLSSFNGSDPNGSWRLYVVDDYYPPEASATPAAQIAGGWTLSVGTEPDPTTTTSSTSSTSSTSTSTTSTTLPPPGGPIEIDDTALAGATNVRITGTITCDQGQRFRIQVSITQDATQGTGVATWPCTGGFQRFRSTIHSTGPGFENGRATVDGTADIGRSSTGGIEETYSINDEVDVDAR